VKKSARRSSPSCAMSLMLSRERRATKFASMTNEPPAFAGTELKQNLKGPDTMARKHEIFRSKYLKAADLDGRPRTVTIEAARTETLKNDRGEETKTVLYFKGVRQALPLNLTNWDSVADVTSQDDSDGWPGHKVELYPTTTEMRGKTVDCIRIRAPAQRELPAKKPAAQKQPQVADPNDEIPY